MIDKKIAMIAIKNYINNLSDKNIPMTIEIPDENNIFHWTAIMIGPKDTPYKNGFFTVDIYFPDDYPKHSPDIYFRTPIYHVNVNHKKPYENKAEKLGQPNISMLKCWNSEYKMFEVLGSVFILFYIADPDCAYETNVAKEYKENRSLYDKKIAYFTKKYACQDKTKTRYDQNWDFSYSNK